MLRCIRKMICAIVIAALVLAAVPAMAESVKAKVSSSSAKIYRTASSSADHVKMKKGTEVTVTAVKGKWAKVKVSGKTGYMPTKYLSKTSSSKSGSAKSSSSSSSKKSASRTAAYVSKDTYVYKKASSSSSKRAISANTKVYVVGKSDGWCKVQNSSGSATGYVKSGCLSKKKVSSKKASSSKKDNTSWKSQVVKMDWFGEGKNVLKKGKYAYIYDIDTGVELRIKRMGGHNHADVEPATAADTAKLKRVAKGNFSWKSHAVILKSGGKYVACGINTEPHGDQTITNNNYDGQFCLHMVNSRTHGSDKVNPNHQKCINQAYNWAH